MSRFEGLLNTLRYKRQSGEKIIFLCSYLKKDSFYDHKCSAKKTITNRYNVLNLKNVLFPKW